MKKILLYSLGFTVLTMVVSALFVFGVFNTSLGTANLIGAEVGVLHGSGEIELHNRIVRDIHDIGNKTKEITAMLETVMDEEQSEAITVNEEGSETTDPTGEITDEAVNHIGAITDEATIKALALAGQDIQAKLKDLTTIFDGNSFTRDKQIVKDTFINDYKPAAEELSYLLINLVEKTENMTEGEETNDKTDGIAKIIETAIETGATAQEITDGTDVVADETNGTAAIQADEETTPTPPGPPAPPAPITADKKTQITNSCAKLIEAHNKFSDVLNQKRRY